MSSESQKKKSKSEKSKSEKSGQNDSSDVIIEDVLESADSSTDKHDVEMSSTNTNSSSSVGSSLTGSESAGGRPSTSTQAENKDEPVDGTKEFWKHVLVQGGCELSGERVDWCATTLHEKDWKKSAFLDLTAAELRTLYGRDKSTRPDGLSDGEANSVAKAIKKYADKDSDVRTKKRKLDSSRVLDLSRHKLLIETAHKNPDLTQGWHSLPFPSLSKATERFRVKDKTFHYLGRTRFQEFVELVRSLRTQDGVGRLRVTGIKGSGKSHIATAFAVKFCKGLDQCQDGIDKRVVFVANSDEVIKDPVYSIVQALTLTFADSPEDLQRLQTIEREKEVIRFVRSVAPLIFIIDNHNKLDTRSSTFDKTDNRAYEAAKFIGRLSSGNVFVEISSANNDQASKREQDVKYMTLNHGLDSKEAKSWYDTRQKELPQISPVDLQLLFDLTGGLPLLLETFVTLFQDPKLTFPALCDIVSQDLEVTSARRNIHTWDLAKIKEGSTLLPELWRFYKSASLGMGCCVDDFWYDHRYFYSEKSVAYASCGWVRDVALREVQMHHEDTHRELAKDFSSIRLASNVSSLGFAVEAAVLANIRFKGIHVQDLDIDINLDGLERRYVVFDHSSETSLPLERNATVMYVPLAWNYEAVDCVIRQHKDNFVRIYGVQVTMKRNAEDTHASSKDKFFRCAQARWASDAGADTVEWNWLWVENAGGGESKTVGTGETVVHKATRKHEGSSLKYFELRATLGDFCLELQQAVTEWKKKHSNA